MARCVLVPALLLAGCSDVAGAPPKLVERAEESAPLAELGYADYAESEEAEEDRAREGVVRFDRERAARGYTLCTDIPLARARLFTAAGQVVREWHDEATTHWDRAEFAKNGDLLVIATGRRDPKRSDDDSTVVLGPQLLRYAFDGTLLWRRNMAVHHDMDELPDGRILILTEELVLPGEPFPESGVKDNSVTLLAADGSILERVSLFELLESAADFEWIEPPEPPLERVPLGLLHCNSVQWLERDDLPEGHPLREPRTVLVSSRHQNAVFAFQWDRREIVWFYGRSELQGQHEAQLLPNGNVLLLDNGFPGRHWSRVLEIDPTSNRIVWEWGPPRPEGFYTSGRGMVQLLERGNVFVVNSDDGELFELTRDGDIVWRYLNPSRDKARGARATLRATRYTPEFVKPLFDTR